MWLLFRYNTYYPSGGEGDFAGRFATREEAEEAHKSARFRMDYADVYDVDKDEWHSL